MGILLLMLAGSSAMLMTAGLRAGLDPGLILAVGSVALAGLTMALAASRDELRRVRQDLRDTEATLERVLAEDP